LFADLGLRDDSKKKELIPVYKKCNLKLGFRRTFKRQSDDYKWAEFIVYILTEEKEVDLAIFINNSIIESIDWKNSYHLDQNVQRVYEILLKNYFISIWPKLSNALLSNDENYITYYELKHILGSHIGGTGRNLGVLFDADLNAIFNWCEMNKPLAPERFAELIPIFDNNNTNYSKWHPIVLRVFDEFGEIREVLDNIGSNMRTFFWSGSVVPFLESKKILFEELGDHKIALVRHWASRNIDHLVKEIEREKNNDAEHFI
jgi:hypothetical protein